jgi:two-component system response regulator QseB
MLTVMKLLLVEDDRMIGEAVRRGLRQEGFTLDWVQDGRAAELALDCGQYALVILDLGLPRRDGLTVLKGLRTARNPVPVLILTARDSISDRVTGLDAGADDYLIKPFDLDELAARIRALLRRHAGRPEPTIQWGALAVKPDTREVTLRGRSVALSAREYALLAALLERPGTALSRAQLEERLYGWGQEVESNAVEVHIHNLRRKLGPDLIRNVRGVGYLVALTA